MENGKHPGGNADREVNGNEIDKQINEISELLKVMEEDVKEKDTSFYKTVKSWAARRNSHSIPNIGNNIKQRANPNRGNESLTYRDRCFLYHQEEIDIEELQLKELGFDRSYGKTWPKGSMSSSTPIYRQQDTVRSSSQSSKPKKSRNHGHSKNRRNQDFVQNHASMLVFHDPTKDFATTPTTSRRGGNGSVSQTRFKMAL